MKKIISIVLALVLFCAVLPIAYADAFDLPAQTTDSVSDSPISTRVEEVGWYYRINNGVMEKRLWSYTYGVWLTDWIPVDQ